MTIAAVPVTKLTLTIDSLDVSPITVSMELIPPSPPEQVVVADGTTVSIKTSNEWTLRGDMLFEDAAAGFFRASCYTKAGQSAAFTAVINPPGESSTVTGTVILWPQSIPLGTEQWGSVQRVSTSLSALVTGWTTT